MARSGATLGHGLVGGALALVAALAALALLLLPVRGGVDRDSSTARGGSWVPCTLEAPTTADGYTRAFATLWGRWAGGDQASSVELPDGRILWLFADTLQGVPALAGGVADARFVHNSFVVQDGGCFTPLTGAAGSEVIPNPGPGTWYWPQQGLVLGDRLWVTAIRVTGGQGNGLDFTVGGVDLAEFTLGVGGLPTFLGLHLTPASAAGDFGVLWGTGLARSGAWIHLYGTRRVPGALVGKELLLARVPAALLDDPGAWQYRTTSGWSADPFAADVLPVPPGGVSTALSAHRTGLGWVLVTKRGDFLGDMVVALVGPSAWGPFEEVGLFGSPSTPASLEYLALAHPEVALADGSLLVSVNHNAASLDAVLSDPIAFRPTFRSVTGLH